MTGCRRICCNAADTGRTGPTALLILKSENDDTADRQIEMSEEMIAKRGIAEGKRVCFSENGELLRIIRVVAAVIKKDDRIFATARGYGEYKDWWEFPGGKIESGETADHTLIRTLPTDIWRQAYE